MAASVKEAAPVAADYAVWTMPYNSTNVNSSGSLASFTNVGSGNGVYGASNGGFGVYGVGAGLGFGSSSTGVGGATYSSPATPGTTAGVYGLGNGTNTSGVYGTNKGAGAGVLGVNFETSANGGSGVMGTSTTGIGVYGVNTGGGGTPYGVVGAVTTAPGISVYGVATVPGTVAFAGGTSVAGGIAGQFSGPVNFYGQITLQQQTQPPVGTVNAFVVGPGVTKNAAVPLPDGSHGLLHCVEAPEPWFEDFGEGQLVAGTAEVKLEANFAATVDTHTLHVFFTEHTEHHALVLTGRSATGFTVAADAATLTATGKKLTDANGTFTWRVVAKRKDVKGERFARFALPKEIKLAPPPSPQPPQLPPSTGPKVGQA